MPLEGAAASPRPLPSFDAISETNIEGLALDVRFGSKADMCGAKWNVRFSSKSRHDGNLCAEILSGRQLRRQI